MKTPETPLAVIFDLDGVLFDTVPLIWQAYNRVLKRYGVELTDELIAEYEGQPLRQQLDAINARYGTSIGFDEFKRQSTPIERRVLAHVPPNPGARPLLEALQAAGIPLAVGTSAPQRSAVRLLKEGNLRDYFAAVVAEEDVERHKPNPAVFLKAAKRLHAAPEHCVVIEDAPAGITAATAAGMKRIGLISKFTIAANLAGSDLIVDSLEQVSVDKLNALIA